MSEAATKQRDEILTLPEAARYVKLSEDTLRRQIQNGVLTAVKLLGRYRIKASDLRKWYAGR